MRWRRRPPNPAARVAFLDERVKAGDFSTIAAVLKSPAFLSGITEAQQKVLRDQIEAMRPDESKQLAFVNKCIPQVELGMWMGLVRGRFNKAFANNRPEPVRGNAAKAIAKVGGAK